MKKKKAKVDLRAAKSDPPVSALPLNPAPAPPMLLVLECCFADGLECSTLLSKVPPLLLMEWEELLSPILQEGLQKIRWWERCFQKLHPVTYDRFKMDVHDLLLDWREFHRRSLRKSIYHGDNNGGHDKENNMRAVGSDGGGLEQRRVAVISDSELGMQSGDGVVLCPSSFVVQWMDGAKVDLGQQEAFDGAAMRIARIWPLRLMDACVVLLRSRSTGHGEVVWVRKPSSLKQQHLKEEKGADDVSFWAINRNNYSLGDLDNFVVPPFLHGDPSLGGSAAGVLVTACYGAPCTAVVLRHRYVLFFDQKGKRNNKNKNGCRHWRELVSTEMALPSVIPMSACCFVLDEFLLLAHYDGVLRAHPRRNPRSTYFVEDVGSLVPHMTSLFNVVALIRSYCVLEVRLVSKCQEDPFIKFELLYTSRFADCDFAPLLYGPYVVFRGLDGSWYRVCYDKQQQNRHSLKRELIPLPFPYSTLCGWAIQAIHCANMDTLTMTLRNMQSGQSVIV